MSTRSRRRTAEQEVIEAAFAWKAGSWARAGNPTVALYHALRKLEDIDLEVPDATPTSADAPETSAEAAKWMSGQASKVAGQVFREIYTAHLRGAIGLTTDAIEVRLRRSHQSVSPRVTDLRNKGWIKDAGYTRETRGGHKAVVWAPTDMALATVPTLSGWSW